MEKDGKRQKKIEKDRKRKERDRKRPEKTLCIEAGIIW